MSKAFGAPSDKSVHTTQSESSPPTHGLNLTRIEKTIFSLLIQGQGKAVSRQEINAAVWGNNEHVGDRTIDTHVSNLRKKTKAAGITITCVPRAGYVLNF